MSQIHIEFNRTNYRGAVVWNSQPSEIRNINFYNLFKKIVKIICSKTMIPNNSNNYIIEYLSVY